MVASGRISRRYWIAVALLLAVFFAQSYSASLLKSPTFDEPAHIGAGLSYWQTGAIVANPQHPPLLKEMAGLALLAAGIRLPNSMAVHNMEAGAAGAEYLAGSELLRDQGPAHVLFWARLPFILLATLLGLLLFWWGRQMLGDAGALAALFLYAFSPTILAHSYLVTTDLGLAAFTVLFFFALWSYLRYPSWQRMLACGAAMGAVLAAKFSALALPPVGALLMFASLRWPPERTAGSPRPFWDRDHTVAPPAGKNDPCPCGSGKKYKMCHGAQSAAAQPPSAASRLLRCALVFLILCAVAAVVVEACYFFPSDPLAYLAGVHRVNADHNPNSVYLLAGQLGKHFLSYFAVVWLLKEPLAALLPAAVGLAALLRNRTIPVLVKLFLLLPPAVLFAGYSIAADDLGIRYLIPILPFAYLVGGWGLAALATARSWWPRAAAAALALWMVVAAAGIYPDHLSYFNELACLPSHASEIGLDGGSRCGVLWLDEHNVDWGQGLQQLQTWLARHAPGRTVKLAYYGYFPPEYYGLHAQAIGTQQLVESKAPPAGLYAISAHFVA
ncbi:MAG TPA: glycosyltransferase family 39 protein, partial [Bryobacteraceae bacterium]|nr:glycosyltransferase family 39 protein [Bryobacteraceae bacterium]